MHEQIPSKESGLECWFNEQLLLSEVIHPGFQRAGVQSWCVFKRLTKKYRNLDLKENAISLKEQKAVWF